jgi:hypothetical protein
MDIERAIQFILENDAKLQAKLDAHVDASKADIAYLRERQERADRERERADREHERADRERERADRELAAIREILLETTTIQQEQGRILVRIESTVAKLGAAQVELTVAQQITETKLQAFIDSLRSSGNGHSNGGSHD